MSKGRKYITILNVGVFFFIIGCLDPYSAPDLANTSDLLVVDGFVNSSSKSATVKLSRTIPLSSDMVNPPETKASVTIEDESGKVFSLSEKQNGTYEATNLLLDGQKKYLLHIKTKAGKEYKSSLIELTNSPVLDSVTWHPNPQGVQLYVNAHDPTNKTKFYQWTFTETWKYTSTYFSSYKIVNGTAVPRSASEDIYTCWSTENSSQILINSTDRLAEAVVRDFPLTFLPRGSKKVSAKYSILVQQRALTEEAYNYWLQLQKTTENLGGLFDPLPSQVTGNIQCVSNASEPVLGYFTGGTVREQRIYINFNDLPDYLLYVPSTGCTLDSIPLQNIRNYPNTKLLVTGYGITLAGYTSSTNDCIDCRVSGGTTTKPDFWP